MRKTSTHFAFLTFILIILANSIKAQWQTNGNNIYYNTGNVGIGTTTPQSLLSLGTGLSSKKLALYDKASSWYGFGIESGLMRLQISQTVARFGFFVGDTKEIMTIKGNGRVGIGTTNPQAELAVNGSILAKEIQVRSDGWADYVFEKNYVLKPITEVENFIKANKHLPDVPTTKEVERDGVKLGKMNKILLQKIEELTLYIIQQNKSIENIQEVNKNLQNELNAVKQQLRKN